MPLRLLDQRPADGFFLVVHVAAFAAGCPACREEHDSLFALVSGQQAL